MRGQLPALAAISCVHRGVSWRSLAQRRRAVPRSVVARATMGMGKEIMKSAGTREKKVRLPYDEDKMRELVLHIASRSEGDVHFGAVKLNKLLFLADFIAYRKFGRPMTGAEYQKLDFGPAARPLKPLLERMEHEKAIAEQVMERWGYPQRRTVALREAILGKFSADEIALVDALIMNHRGRNARWMSDLSHTFVGWQLARLGETIPYSVALVSRRRPT